MRLPTLLALAALALAGCAGGDPGTSSHGSGGHPHVAMRDNEFQPDSITVHAGETLGWVNEGQRTHTVSIHSSAGGFLKDTAVAPGGETEHVFAQPGTYHLVCRHHEAQGMDMIVVVE